MKQSAMVVLAFAAIMLCTGCDRHAVIPEGTTLYRPHIEHNECVFLYVDYISEVVDGKPYAETQAAYSGTATMTIECPYNRSPDLVKVTLAKTENDRLLWVRSADLRPL